MEDRAPVPPRQRRAAAHEGDRPRRRLPRRDARRAVVHRRAALQGAVRAAGDRRTHVSNTNAFRAPDGEDEAAFCRRLLDELEEAIVRPRARTTVAMIIAEPVQNAGGCLVAARRLLAGPARDRRPLRRSCSWPTRSSAASGASASGSASSATASCPDIATTAKGLTSAYAPMGAVMVSDRVAAPLYDDRRARCCTASRSAATRCARRSRCGTSRSSSATAILENVRALEPYLEAGCDELSALPIVGDVRGAGFFWARRAGQGRREHALRRRRARAAAARLPARPAAARPGSSPAPTTAATRSCRSRRR